MDRQSALRGRERLTGSPPFTCHPALRSFPDRAGRARGKRPRRPILPAHDGAGRPRCSPRLPSPADSDGADHAASYTGNVAKIVVITGGSRGIGAATARQAAERGWTVAVNYRRDEAAARQVVRDIERAGGRALAARADVSVEEDVVRLFDDVERRLGRVTALVNNAGLLERQTRVDALDAARLTRVFATNVVGSFLCAREAVRRMSTRYGGAGGTIVNVSSRAAVLGSAGEYVDYAASKGAVDTLTVGLAREVAPEGIRVNGVRPGLIETDIHALGGEPGRVARLASGVPLGRGGQAEEVAAAIVWLLSDEASYVTGSIVDVSGGR